MRAISKRKPRQEDKNADRVPLSDALRRAAEAEPDARLRAWLAALANATEATGSVAPEPAPAADCSEPIC